jgi:carbonic anhydrase
MLNHGWDYGHNLPPQLWHLLKDSKAHGRKQSPIAIDSALTVTNAPPLPSFNHYKAVALSDFVFTSSHLEVESPSPTAGGYVEHEGNQYFFSNFHLHTPSEHTFDGKYSAMEIHVVHTYKVTPKKSKKLVVGVRVTVGEENAELGKLIELIANDSVRYRPAHFAEKVAKKTINPKSLYPQDSGYFYYMGSLTTPPCTEGIPFFLFDTPIEVSQEQLETIEAYAPGGNNRPIQALNGRKVWRG